MYSKLIESQDNSRIRIMNEKQLHQWFKTRLGYEGNETFLSKDVGIFEVHFWAEPSTDRIRIHTSICDVSDVNIKEVLEANFHSTQDVNYAIHKGKIFAVFTHWFGDLTERELDEAFQQIIQLAQNTIHGEYYSGNMILVSAYNEALKDKLTKTKVKKLWSKCQKITAPKQRGKEFEIFVKKLLSLEQGFRIVKPNMRTVNEEIDILVQNKIISPHWLKYGSPYIFVECKNHKEKIESKDIREFVAKIRNHPGHCTMGFYFSVSDFTKGCFSELVGIRNTPIKLVLINGKMVDDFFKTNLELKEFLEEQIPESIK